MKNQLSFTILLTLLLVGVAVGIVGVVLCTPPNNRLLEGLYCAVCGLGVAMAAGTPLLVRAIRAEKAEDERRR